MRQDTSFRADRPADGLFWISITERAYTAAVADVLYFPGSCAVCQVRDPIESGRFDGKVIILDEDGDLVLGSWSASGAHSKAILFGFLPPQFHSEDRAVEVNRALAYYASRPYEGLGGATPTEIYLGLEPAHLRAVQPPRGKLGAPCASHNIEVPCLDGERRFPYLRRAA